MKVSGMKWDNPNNASMSLRILSELVRAGDAQCFRLTGSGESVIIRLESVSKKISRKGDLP